jgi:CheY-like chemotaxis protein
MKVLIVDDHPIVHAGLRRLIAAETDAEIAEAATANEALARFTEDRPDLVIMDLNLPGSGGLEMIRRMITEDTSARILVFSVHDDSIHVARGARLCDEERAARPDFARHLPRRRGAQLHRARDRSRTRLAHRQDARPVASGASL